jgi:hypothetical protein
MDSTRFRVVVNKFDRAGRSGNLVEMLIREGIVEAANGQSAIRFGVASNRNSCAKGTAIADSLYPRSHRCGCGR